MSCATSRRATDRCGRFTGSRSQSSRARSSPSSARTAPARRRRSARSRARSDASGQLIFDGKPLGRRGPEAVAKLGVAHVPEGRGTFAELSVEENLRLGAYVRRGGSIDDDIARVSEYFPWIATRLDQHAGTLSGGEQQMLALARALMSHPRMLLLDEPSLGLAPLITREIFRIVSELNEKEGLTVLVVEQNAAIALEVASYAYVLEVGKVAVSGPSEELARNESVRKSYLGY